MPRISIIMPVYNSEKYVGEAITSMLSQTYKNFEFIIIDDCSKDNSAQIINAFQDDRIIFIQNKENKGFLFSLNYGISIAKGEYIARLDDDDISYPQRLQKQIEYMDSNEAVVLLGTRKKLIVNGKTIAEKKFPITNSAEIKFSLLFGNYCMAHSSFMMRKKTLIDNNIKYETFVQTPDHHIQLTLLQYGELDMIDEPLVAWRIHPEQSTQIRSRNLKMGEEDRTRCLYINGLPLREKFKNALKKGVCRDMQTKEDYQTFIEAMLEYALICKMSVSKEELKTSLCCKFIFRDICTQQKHNLHLLKVYCTSDFKDLKWLFSKDGIEFIIKCLICYNHRWFGPINEEEK